tara:strand:- start:122 stop:1330 length:1209 start_codon:yes stop_codon:yes gene_type:complete
MSKFCAPGKGDSISCFSLKSLERIATHWNSQNKNNLIKLSQNKLVLWKRIKEKMRTISKCPDEWCWLDTDLLKNIKDKDILEKSFRPKMPFPWKKNIETWLNTLDIANVLEQYPFKFKDFEFIGPVPLDFDKKLDVGQCVVNELCNLNIETLHKKGKTKLGIVFNFDPHTQNGSHWVALFADFNKGGIYYFDSYGYKPLKEIGRLLARIHSQSNNLLYKNGLDSVKKMDNTHATVCRVEYVNPTTVKFSCREFVKGLYKGDLVQTCNLGRIKLDGKLTKKTMNRLCDNSKELRMVKDIDTIRKLVTLDRPLTNLSNGCNGMIHKCNKIYINKNRHQYKNSECGTYSIYFITQLLHGTPFHKLGNGKIILDDKMNKKRTYFYRPNHDQTDENEWLSEMFKDEK